MNISFAAHYETFRDEVRRFLDENLTDELRDAQRLCPGIFWTTNTISFGTVFCINKAGSLPVGPRNTVVLVGI